LMESIERIKSSQGKTLGGSARIELRLRPALMDEIYYLQSTQSYIIMKVNLSPSYQDFVPTWQDKQLIVFFYWVSLFLTTASGGANGK